MFDGLGQTTIKAKVSEVQAVVAAAHGMDVRDLKVRCRKHRFAHPRFEVMFLARELTSNSLPGIGRLMGGFDHTSVLYGIRKIAKRVETDAALAARLAKCREAIAILVAKRAEAAGIPQGSSSEWTPPPPLQIAKPSSVSVAFDVVGWNRIGGEMEAAA